MREQVNLTVGDLPWPMLLVSSEGRITSGNQQAALLLGLDDAAACEERFEIASGSGVPLPGDDLPWRRLAREGEFVRRELWFDRISGSRLTLQVRGMVLGSKRLLCLEDESGHVLTNELADLVASVSTALLGADEPTAAARLVVEQVQRVLAADVVLLLQAERDPERLVLLGAHGLPELFTDERQEVLFDAPLLVAVAARTRALQETPELARLDAETLGGSRKLLELGLHSFVALPMLADGELIGVLALARRQPGYLTAIERHVLDAVASSCALGLQRARAHEADRRAFVLLQSLQAAVTAVQEGRPHEENLRWLVDEARKLTGSRYAAMGVRDPRTGQLSDFVHAGMDPETVRRMPHFPEGRGLLGAVLHERQAIRVPDISRDPRSSGVPAGHPHMTTFLGVPIFVGGEVFGNFYLTDKLNGQEYSVEDERLVRLLAAQAALMIAYSKQVRINEEQRLTLEAVLREAPDGILFFGAPDNRLVFGNAAAERIFGRHLEPLSPEERAAAWGMLTPEGQPLDPARLPSHRAFRGELAHEEMQIVRPDGSRIEVAMHAAPVSVRDQVLGAVVVVQDVSPYKELERVREELAAVVAHDLRNPIQALLLGMDVLLRRAHDDQVTVPVTRLERMQHTAARLARMVGDLLETSRMELGRLRIEMGVVPLVDAVSSLLNNIRPTLGEHEVQLAVFGTPPAVHADRYRVDQVLTNLLENAARYSPAGTPIEVTVNDVGDGAVLAVRDHGPGIAAADLQRIFDRYYQTRRAREQRTGLGLGLYITRSLVNAQGGRIWVESTPGAGSTFFVWLPAAHAEIEATP